MRFDGTSWSAPEQIDSSGKPSSVSCPSTAFCVVVDKSGNTVVSSGGKWGAPAPTDPGRSFSSVSCASSAFCLAVDTNSYFASYEGGLWSPATPLVVSQLSSVSCPSASFCVAVDDGSGYVMSYDGLAWGSEIRSIEMGGGLRSVSCPTAGFCAAVDDAGNTLTYGTPLPVNGRPPVGGPNPVRSTPWAGGTPLSVRAALAETIALGRKMTRIRALLRQDGYATTFHAPTAGHLAIAWRAQTDHVGAKPALLVASLSETIKATGVTSVRVALTRRGRQLLLHSRRVAVTSSATFTQPGGMATTVTHRLNVRR